MYQYSIFDYIEDDRKIYKVTQPIRLIELFAGIGSQAMALKTLGVPFEHWRICEIDPFAVKSYNAIHGTNFTTADITKIHGNDLGVNDDGYIYMMTYSFPCQDLSVAGKMRGMNKQNQQKEGMQTRSGLLWEVERLLDESRYLPQILIMENVTQVHSQANMIDFQSWLDYLNSKGYSNFWKDCDAKQYGVAQSRNRCICVSILGNYRYEFPEEIPLQKCMDDYLEDEVDEKYFIRTEKAEKLLAELRAREQLVPRKQRKCMYCENLLGNKGSLGMCNKHYIQYKRWGDPLHSDNKPRATVDGYYRDGKTGRREHRVIWEEYYHEKLSNEEIIHHINFVKTDNRIENLWKYQNASEHIQAHREYERLLESLSDEDTIVFEKGKYIKRERERERERDSDRQTIDLCLKNPRVISVANCISARQDRGISNMQSEGSGVCEKHSVFKPKQD